MEWTCLITMAHSVCKACTTIPQRDYLTKFSSTTQGLSSVFQPTSRPLVEELGIGLKKNYSIYDVDDAYKVVLDVLMEKYELAEPPKDASKEVGWVDLQRDRPMLAVFFCIQRMIPA